MQFARNIHDHAEAHKTPTVLQVSDLRVGERVPGEHVPNAGQEVQALPHAQPDGTADQDLVSEPQDEAEEGEREGEEVCGW